MLLWNPLQLDVKFRYKKKISAFAQDDEGAEEDPTEELCNDRPADEYFRLSNEGDCRDVVRYVVWHVT